MCREGSNTDEAVHHLPRPDARHLEDQLLTALFEVGQQYFGTQPWHVDPDPFRKLLAEVLLTRTTRKVVGQLYPTLARRYPSPQALTQATEEELLTLLRPAGLRTRTLQLRQLAARIAELSHVPEDRHTLVALPLVGEYTADAVLLYVHHKPAFPLDSSVQRVLHRSLRGVDPDRPSPYRDPFLLALRDRLLHAYRPDCLAYLHQGILAIAWYYCRSTPRCYACPLRTFCRFARARESQAAEPGP